MNKQILFVWYWKKKYATEGLMSRLKPKTYAELQITHDLVWAGEIPSDKTKEDVFGEFQDNITPFGIPFLTEKRTHTSMSVGDVIERYTIEYPASLSKLLSTKEIVPSKGFFWLVKPIGFERLPFKTIHGLPSREEEALKKAKEKTIKGESFKKLMKWREKELKEFEKTPTITTSYLGEAKCPFCGRLHKFYYYVDSEEGHPHLEPSSCECGASFFFDYFPAIQEGLTHSVVADLNLPQVKGMFPLAQKFR